MKTVFNDSVINPHLRADDTQAHLKADGSKHTHMLTSTLCKRRSAIYLNVWVCVCVCAWLKMQMFECSSALSKVHV